MADDKQPRPDFIQSANRSGKEARELFERDLNRRLADQGRILSADDMSGLYDPKRQLFTTIDGQPRPLTFDDLKAFSAAVRDIRNRHKGKQYRGGIRPKQVVDLSRQEDRERARKEIHSAAPVMNRGGMVHFQTNAGPNYGATRHHVYVEFLNYNAVVASPATPAKLVKELTEGNIKFDCDCGRHTFWFRFIATIGGFNYGRAEDGFPKVRNPKLYGVACKHVLRVMALISQSPTFRQYAVKMIEHGRKTLDARRQTVNVADMQAFDKQVKAESWRQRSVRTSQDKRAQRQAQPSYQKRLQDQAAQKAAKKTAGKPKITDTAFIKNLMTMGFSKAQAEAALAATKGTA